MMKPILSTYRILNWTKSQKNKVLERESNPSLLPIVIGVTGHRDLIKEDIPQLESSVRKIFQVLRDIYPKTPLHLLSPLAEGADRLVARIGLEFKVKLIVPLPMPRAEYEKDFETPESKTDFAELLDIAGLHFEIPFTKDNTLNKVQNNKESRNQQYTQVGAYIAEHCQILIALWDGVFKKEAGGTSDIIRFRIGDPELQDSSNRIWDPADSGPVYHIVTRHDKNLKPEGGEIFSLHKRFPGGLIDHENMDKAYRKILKRINDFNNDAIRLETDNPKAVLQSNQYLIDLNSVPNLSSSCRTILEHYAISDALAIQFQKKRRRTMIGLFVLVGLAVGSMENYDGWLELFPKFYILLLAYLGFLGIAFLWHFLAKSLGYQNKHLEYRALAEGFRVQFFWELAGIKENVSQKYLRKQRSELEWIRNTIRSSNISAEKELPNAANHKCNYCHVLKYWVTSQKQYYQKAATRDERKVKKFEKTMWLLITLGIGIASVLVFAYLLKLKLFQDEGHKALRILMQIAPAIGAAFGGYAMKMALAEQAKRYCWMEIIYSRAEQCLAKQIQENDLDGAQKVLQDLGEEALIENGDWLLLHRERPMEVPMGG
jgi:hypothetical protein